MGIEWGAISDVADKLTVVALLIFIIIAGVRRWWVFGWTYRETIEREKEWKDLALAGTKIAEHFAKETKNRRTRSTDNESSSTHGGKET